MLNYFDPESKEFQLSINIQADSSLIYYAWASPGDMQTWGMKKAHFFSPKGKLLDPNEIATKGDTFTWVWPTWPDYILEGKIITSKPYSLLVLDLDSAGLLTIEIENISNGLSTLRLKHSQKEENEFDGFGVDCWLNSWTFWLINLKSFLEHGVLLHEKNISLVGKERLEIVNQ